MKQKEAKEVKVDFFNLSDEADKVLYQDLLEKDEFKLIKITRDEFIYSKKDEPIITIWYKVME